jgi:hypothetical protein
MARARVTLTERAGSIYLEWMRTVRHLAETKEISIGFRCGPSATRPFRMYLRRLLNQNHTRAEVRYSPADEFELFFHSEWSCIGFGAIFYLDPWN